MEGNREEIIKLAREAGMVVYDGDQDRVLFEGGVMDCLTRFFHKAQAAEREKVAEEIFDMCKEGWWDSEGMRHHWNKRGQA